MAISTLEQKTSMKNAQFLPTYLENEKQVTTEAYFQFFSHCDSMWTRLRFHELIKTTSSHALNSEISNVFTITYKPLADCVSLLHAVQCSAYGLSNCCSAFNALESVIAMLYLLPNHICMIQF